MARRRVAAGDDRMCKLGVARGPNPAAEAFQRRIPASPKSQLRREFVAEEKKFYIYIYAYGRLLLSKATYSAFRLYMFCTCLEI